MNASPFRTWKRLRPMHRAPGLALVETAIMLVVVTLILLGTLQFGYVFHVHHSMVNAARDAARRASARNASTSDAMSFAQNRLNGFPHAFDVHVQISDNAKSINRDVQVSISMSMHGLSFGLLGDGDLRAQATMRRDASGI